MTNFLRRTLQIVDGTPPAKALPWYFCLTCRNTALTLVHGGKITGRCTARCNGKGRNKRTGKTVYAIGAILTSTCCQGAVMPGLSAGDMWCKECRRELEWDGRGDLWDE